jgi:predicted phosphohydrolase
MSIFEGWENHTERLRLNWNRLVKADDTVVIGGDISWGRTLEQAMPDLEWIDKELNGSKIMVKGNHDYWWDTPTKMRRVFGENEINSIDFLFNNAKQIEEFTLCGTRGRGNTPELREAYYREPKRLENSLSAGVELGSELLVFLHYPPIYSYEEDECIVEILKKYPVKRVFSGHIHKNGMDSSFIGERYGIFFDMISADSLDFTPKIIL